VVSASWWAMRTEMLCQIMSSDNQVSASISQCQGLFSQCLLRCDQCWGHSPRTSLAFVHWINLTTTRNWRCSFLRGLYRSATTWWEWTVRPLGTQSNDTRRQKQKRRDQLLWIYLV
jgi:hypothetical protein